MTVCLFDFLMLYYVLFSFLIRIEDNGIGLNQKGTGALSQFDRILFFMFLSFTMLKECNIFTNQSSNLRNYTSQVLLYIQ